MMTDGNSPTAAAAAIMDDDVTEAPTSVAGGMAGTEVMTNRSFRLQSVALRRPVGGDGDGDAFVSGSGSIGRRPTRDSGEITPVVSGGGPFMTAAATSSAHQFPRTVGGASGLEPVGGRFDDDLISRGSNPPPQPETYHFDLGNDGNGLQGVGSMDDGAASMIDDGASVEDLLSVISARRQQAEAEGFEGDARPLLPKVAFFMGDLRDGLAMVNMQSTFLMATRSFTEKQCGMLFFFFGLAQVLSMAPVGYMLDGSNSKIGWVKSTCLACSVLTVLASMLAQPHGENMTLMIILKIMQGSLTAFQPPGLNSITLGIVGTPGFTLQVSRNKMMCHVGTALIVAIASLLAYFLYPTIGPLFFVSPLFCMGLIYFLGRIRPEHIDVDAARGLIITSPTMTEYEQMDEENEVLMELLREKQAQEANKVDDVSVAHSGSFCSAAIFGPKAHYVPPHVMLADNAAKTGHLKPQQTIESPIPTSINSVLQRHEGGILPATSTMGDSHPQDGPTWQAHDISQDGDQGNIPKPWGRQHRLRYDLPWTASPISQWALDRRNRVNASIQGRMKKAEKSMRQASESMRLAGESIRLALSPLEVLNNPQLMVFTLIVFFFQMSNSCVLPLVMQSIALDDPQSGILLSGLCIVIGQSFMTFFAKICGDYSPIWGRKRLFLLGLFSLPVRCVLLSLMASAEEVIVSNVGRDVLKILMIATQLLDAVGAGIFGTLYILVTNDISGGTGRFSLMLGMTTSAMCAGGTISSYIGQVLAQDFGYEVAFSALGLISFIPAFMYLFLMPETLPDYAKPKVKKRRKLTEILLNIHKRNDFFSLRGSPTGIKRTGSQMTNGTEAHMASQPILQMC